MNDLIHLEVNEIPNCKILDARSRLVGLTFVTDSFPLINA